MNTTSRPSFKFLVLLLPILLLTNCVSHESLVSYTNGEALLVNAPMPIGNPRNIVIQSNDVLEIKVHSQDVLTAAPFNLVTPGNVGVMNNPDLYQLNGYLVDEDGYIDFPILGKISLRGRTVKESKAYLLGRLEEYLKEPVVNIRFLNFRVTISGEINRPGSFPVYNERVTLPEIISLAGDFTPYANRSAVLVVRDENGKRTFATVDMSSSSFFVSDYYYLRENDLVYVEPLDTERGTVGNSSALPFLSALMSLTVLLIFVFR
ncbi:MAG: polysaccharide biosynthesis/export family protein [Bacteroidota bacterium]